MLLAKADGLPSIVQALVVMDTMDTRPAARPSEQSTWRIASSPYAAGGGRSNGTPRPSMPPSALVRQVAFHWNLHQLAENDLHPLRDAPGLAPCLYSCCMGLVGPMGCRYRTI